MSERDMNVPNSRPASPPPTPGQPTSQAEQGRQAADRAREAAERATQRGRETFGQTQARGAQAADSMEGRVDQGLDRAADAAHGLASSLRANASKLPSGQAAELAQQAAGGLERGADYLRETNVAEMGGELQQLIRRYPAQALAVGIGVGFLLARAFGRR